MVFAPGGWGTLFEVFYPLAARQFAPKGIVGIFDEYRRPSELVFISSSSYSDGHFWRPTETLLNEMVTTRACRKQFSHIHLFEPNEGDDAIEAIAEHYERSGRAPTNRATRSPETRAFGTHALERLSTAGLAPRDTTEEVSRPFFALLDNIVAAHITLYHYRNAVEQFQRGDVQDAKTYVDTAVKTAAGVRESTLEILERLSKRPAVQLVGSTKDHLWNEEIERYSRELIKHAVESGSSVVISGCGTEGMSKRWTDLWVQAKYEYHTSRGVDSASELVRVQTAYTGQEQPQRHFEHGYTETLLPTVLTLDTRIELANAIGLKQALALAPGGHAEVLTFVQAALNNQLFGKMYTPYEQRPVFHVLNVPGTEGRPPFYDPLLAQLETMERYKTIRPADYDKNWFTKLNDPIGEASSLARQLLL
jgi:predicted Rossmann-fold nucleotide-binding protein